MPTTRIQFEQVRRVAEKRGKCGCGKYRTRRATFYQTLNPFNVDRKTKLPKTREQIFKELDREVEHWKKVPITCPSCETPTA